MIRSPRQLPLGPAVVVLGPDLRMHHRTEAAAVALLQLNPPDEPIPAISVSGYDIAAVLVAAEHDVPTGTPLRSRIHLVGSRWVTVKASRLDENIAVSIEPSTADERMDVLARACAFSDRESGHYLHPIHGMAPDPEPAQFSVCQEGATRTARPHGEPPALPG